RGAAGPAPRSLLEPLDGPSVNLFLCAERDLHRHRQLQHSARARRLPRVAGALCRRAPARDYRGGQWLERRLGRGRTHAVSNGASDCNQENLGFSKANNQALPLARGEYVLFLNPDSEMQPGTLERMLAELAGFPERAAVGPRVRKPSEFISRNCARRLPTLWTEFCDLMWLHLVFPLACSWTG